jgi:hypothetical protein
LFCPALLTTAPKVSILRRKVARLLPFPPRFDRERRENFPRKLGEN